MSTSFAEKVLDSMVDENGNCGERGLSSKQFDILARYLDASEGRVTGGWAGDYSSVHFVSTDYTGDIGKYHVELNEFWHFHRRCTVKQITLRPQEELEAEAKRRQALKFEGSEWVGEPKQRMDMELTLMRDYEYTREAYGRYNSYETAHIYTLADADGNCYVWKTTNLLEQAIEDGDGFTEYIVAEVGDKVFMKATVKEHGEYRGIKQTVINRPKINRVEKAA